MEANPIRSKQFESANVFHYSATESKPVISFADTKNYDVHHGRTKQEQETDHVKPVRNGHIQYKKVQANTKWSPEYKVRREGYCQGSESLLNMPNPFDETLIIHVVVIGPNCSLLCEDSSGLSVGD